MKILVTGGLGFIGHGVVAQLEAQGHEVVVVDNRNTYGIISAEELNPLMAERQQQFCTHRVFDYDIQDPEGMAWVYRHYLPEMVIHLASFPRQKVVNADPRLGSQTMSEGLLNLLELSARYSVRKFVYLSSSMVYGNFKDTYFDGVSESHATNPIGQYGIMKLAGEWLVEDYARRTGMVSTILRPSAVYGPRDVEDRVVSKFILAAMRGGTIQVNGGKESLDFTHVSDAVDGIVGAAVSDATNNKIYNITRGSARTLLEAAHLVVELVGQGSIQINPADGNFPSRGQLNINKARTDFGFDPATDIEQGFAEYYEWLKNSIYWTKKTV
jgi:nucleoside-diphosphate-sugar epimerase